MKLRSDWSLDRMNARARGRLPELFGLEVISMAQGELAMRMKIQPQFLAPNGYLHAASVIAVADTSCGYACFAHLPDGAENFTTIELKSNFLGTAREGTLESKVNAAHLGRTTQVWDSTVRELDSGRTIALFRCTQLILWPRAK